jgi:hypothetical protein
LWLSAAAYDLPHAVPSTLALDIPTARREQRAAIKEFNRLTTQFITGVMANPGGGFIPTTDWFQAFNMVGADIEALFSQPAKDALKAVDALIGPSRPGRGA